MYKKCGMVNAKVTCICMSTVVPVAVCNASAFCIPLPNGYVHVMLWLSSTSMYDVI